MYVTFLLPQKTRFSQIKKSQAFRKILGSYKKIMMQFISNF